MNVLELYSGIGGMHFAIKESGVAGQVVAAVEINTVANDVYRHNFPRTRLLQRNIQSLSVAELDSMQIDAVFMSPPCQPFTRVGLQKDTADRRTDSFMHFLSLLPTLDRRLRFLLIENVKGFECSETRDVLISTLTASNFTWQEFLVCPTQLGIPNVRTRYYLIAVRRPLDFGFERQDSVLGSVPGVESKPCPTLGEFLCLGDLEGKLPLPSDDRQLPDNDKLLLPDKLLLRWGRLLDIVTPESTRSCCFTKAYGRYVEGAGSVLCRKRGDEIAAAFAQEDSGQSQDARLAALAALGLRWFSPSEVTALMRFPLAFEFPVAVTTRQRHRLLGNSVNVAVVAALIKVMCYDALATA